MVCPSWLLGDFGSRVVILTGMTSASARELVTSSSSFEGPDEGGKFIWKLWREPEVACGGSGSVWGFEPDFNGNKGSGFWADVAPGSAVGADGDLRVSGGDEVSSDPAPLAPSDAGFRAGSGVRSGEALLTCDVLAGSGLFSVSGSVVKSESLWVSPGFWAAAGFGLIGGNSFLGSRFRSGRTGFQASECSFFPLRGV